MNQNGSENLHEFLSMYMPFKMRGVWDMNSCAMTLAEAGFEVVETKEDKDTFVSIIFVKYRLTSVRWLQKWLKMSHNIRASI